MRIAVCRRARECQVSHKRGGAGAAGGGGEPRGNRVLVEALAEVRNRETALEANSCREQRNPPERF